MNGWLVMGLLILGTFIGAVLHESDLARNFHETGNAHAWFVTIKCEDCQENDQK